MKRPEGFDTGEEHRPPDAGHGQTASPRTPAVPRAGGLLRRRRASRADVQESTDDSPRERAGAAADDGARPDADADPASAHEPPDAFAGLPELPEVDDEPDAGRNATLTDLRDVLEQRRAPATQEDDAAGALATARARAADTARAAREAFRRRRGVERSEVRRFTRRSRRRRTAWITVASIAVVFALSIVVGVYSPLMALRTIEIKGASRVDAAQLQKTLDSQLGTPLARVDFDRIKRQMAGYPLIESYVTEEEPPHTLVVTITERTPILAVKTSGGYEQVDPAGIVVTSSPTAPKDLPVADVSSAQIGSSVYRTMAKVVLSLPKSVRATVKDVTATTSDDVTLTMSDSSKVVWGSPEHSIAKAKLLAALVADHEKRDPSTVVEYDVSAPDNGIIRSPSK